MFVTFCHIYSVTLGCFCEMWMLVLHVSFCDTANIIQNIVVLMYHRCSCLEAKVQAKQNDFYENEA